MAKTLFMETTEVSPAKTAAEISACLIAAGATQIAADYKDGQITGLRWTMKIGATGNAALFALPTRVEPIYNILRKRRTGYLYPADEAKLRQKAERVAWRQLLRWVQAQMAMIDIGMLDAAEVFMPYIEISTGKSMYAALQASTEAFPLITDGKVN